MEIEFPENELKEYERICFEENSQNKIYKISKKINDITYAYDIIIRKN